jgi:hypothetical protein
MERVHDMVLARRNPHELTTLLPIPGGFWIAPGPRCPCVPTSRRQAQSYPTALGCYLGVRFVGDLLSCPPTSMCDCPARISFRAERSRRADITIVLDAGTVYMAFLMRFRRRFANAITRRTHTKATTNTTSAA